MDVNPTGVFINGPDGKLEAKYVHGKGPTPPTICLLHPHPEYGGTMNNKVIYNSFHTFVKLGFSTCRFNFRGVGRSEGKFDNGQGELSDAASVMDWLQKQNPNTTESWIFGYSFGSLICMQLLMRRPEIYRFISACPQPNIYDFNFLAPCPASGLIIYSDKDQLVPIEATKEMEDKLKVQKGVKIEFVKIAETNHFFLNKDKEFSEAISKYIKKESRF